MDREAAGKYLTQQVTLASPEKLVAMLYDRAIMLLHEVLEAIEADDVERRWQANSKATEIIAELWQAVDRERGGEIAANLNQIYGVMMMHLSMVDVENSAEAARNVIRLIEPLCRSWHEIADGKSGNTDSDVRSTDETATGVSLSA